MNFSPLDILLIESDASVIKLVRTALTNCISQQFSLHQIDQLEAGLAWLAAGGRADVILVCLALPDQQGLLTLRRLREQALATPLIVLSHDNDDTAAVSAVQAGAQDFLIQREIDHTLVSAMRHAIERAQLFAELRAARDELEQRVAARTAELHAEKQRLRQLSHRLVEVQETERRHLARELHDEVGQLLTGLKLRLEICQRLPREESTETLAEAQGGVNELVRRVREMSLNLRPAVLDDLGLLAAFHWLFQRYTAQTGVRVDFSEVGLKSRRFAPELETAAFRIVQEALTNVARHAAVQQATVQATLAAEFFTVQIRDAGRGFDPQAMLAAHTSNGLAGMSERALLLGGQLEIVAAPGQGASITAHLPLQTG